MIDTFFPLPGNGLLSLHLLLYAMIIFSVFLSKLLASLILRIPHSQNTSHLNASFSRILYADLNMHLVFFEELVKFSINSFVSR